MENLLRLVGVPSREVSQARAAAALATRWVDLEPAIRSDAIVWARALLTRCAVDFQGRAGAANASAARLIGDLGEPGLAHAVPVLLLDEEAAGAAEEALVCLAGAVSGFDVTEILESRWAVALPGRGDTPPAPTPEARRDLHARVAALAAAFTQHRRPGVLKAAIVLLDPGTIALSGGTPRDPLARWFQDAGHESHMALRGVLKRSAGALARQRAWEWLGRGLADTACVERLSRGATLAEHEAVLARGHLRLNPARARRLRQVRATGTAMRQGRMLLPGARQMRELPARCRWAIPGVAGALPLCGEAMEEVFRPLVSDADAAVRFAALVEGPAHHAIALACDRDERIASVAGMRAVLAGAAAGPEAARGMLERVQGSQHAGVRNLARVQLEAIDPWDAGNERSRLSARCTLAQDRRGFVRELRRRVDGGDASVRTAAIMVARRLSLVADIELELLRLAATIPKGPDEERLAATAVAALGEASSGAARSAVRACASHAVARVRANAVEAMLRPAHMEGGGLTADVVELKHDPCHRVRANVLRAVLLSQQGKTPAAWAAADLSFMLADSRPLHRLAGLWVLERVVIAGGRTVEVRRRWNELASKLADLTRDEPEAPVRERAARCARLMLSQMGTNLGRSAALHGAHRVHPSDTEAAA